MTSATGNPAPFRHAWLDVFNAAPEAGVADLLGRYADISPYQRADPPEVADKVFGGLPEEDLLRSKLDDAIYGWLALRRTQPLPEAPPRLQRHIREVCDALEIVALLKLCRTGLKLRQEYVRWAAWFGQMAASPARDALAEYYRTLALTQAQTASLSTFASLEPLWLSICRRAGSDLPERYLDIGLLGLRRLPAPAESDSAWLAGLAQWALATGPTDAAFNAQWFPLKALFPRAPGRWRKLVSAVLNSKSFKDRGVEAPAWWRGDEDFAPMMRADFVSSRPAQAPHRNDCDAIIGIMDRPFVQVERAIDRLLADHHSYARTTGDTYYYVRAVHALGTALVGHATPTEREPARKASAIVQTALSWEPHNAHLWSLWRDSLAAQGDFTAAEGVGWNFVRRAPDDPEARTQLAGLLVRFPNRRAEAEMVLRETISLFPDNVYAVSQLGELLLAEDRTDDALRLVDGSMAFGRVDSSLYSLKARIQSHRGDQKNARRTLLDGINHSANDSGLKHMLERLDTNQGLILTSKAFEKEILEVVPAESNEELAGVVRLGELRKLRLRLENTPDAERTSLLDSLRHMRNVHPEQVYADVLLTRFGEADRPSAANINIQLEAALADENLAVLSEIGEAQPRYRVTTLVARSLLGDSETAESISGWLDGPATGSRSDSILHSGLRNMLANAPGEVSARTFLRAPPRSILRVLLYDAIDASLGDALLAA